MREPIEDRFIALVSGQHRGIPAGLARAGLRVAAGIYAGALTVRNAWYDGIRTPVGLGIPVISVGNITVGGTGKTPMVAWLCDRLIARGQKPAVLSRGYRGTDEAGPDEPLMLARRCPRAVVLAHADRVRMGRLAVAEYAATVAVLDDGFQHRRVNRDLDLVLIDATRPFGFGYVLPRGLLREPMRGLGRAHGVVLTRCDQCSPEKLQEVEDEVRGWAGQDVPILRAVHAPRGLTTLAGEPIAGARPRRVGMVSAIARPEAFAATLQAEGFTVAAALHRPDHHPYSLEDAGQIADWARRQGIEAILTTEKDAVKLARLAFDWPVPMYVQRIDLAFLDDGAVILEKALDAILECTDE